jgi:formaldehyde-activating enzyme
MADVAFFTGEATVFAADGQFTDAMPEVLIGSVDGPAGQAFATMMGQSAGHTRMFAVRDCNQMVRPATMMVSKVTMRTSAYVNLFGSVVQAAIADAVVDSVIDGVLPREQVDRWCVLIMVWLDPRCATDATLDRADLYRTNHEATKLAIRRALTGEPSIETLIANRHSVTHCMLQPGDLPV